ncbi:MAG: hypothetical protein QXU75_06710 [Candidatus Methanomethylicaceae archaeon]
MWDPEPDELVQLGSGVVNWRARIVRPLEDPVRGILEAACSQAAWDGKQGRLEWAPWPSGVEFPEGWGQPWGVVFNHTLCGGVVKARRVIRLGDWLDGGYFMVAAVQFEDGVVVSPDHDHVRVPKGKYVFRHKFPEGGGKVD